MSAKSTGMSKTDAIRVCAAYWLSKLGELCPHVTDEQARAINQELIGNLGTECALCKSQFDGGSWGYDFEDCQVVPNAFRDAGITDFNPKRHISLYIVQWWNAPDKYSVAAYDTSGTKSRCLDHWLHSDGSIHVH